MRLVVLAVALFAVGASIKCYDGLIRWGPGNEEPGLTLKECATTCCTVVWSLPGTIYSCGERCPSQREFVRGEKCESAPVDSSWCHCSGPVGKCKPKLMNDSDIPPHGICLYGLPHDIIRIIIAMAAAPLKMRLVSPTWNSVTLEYLNSKHMKLCEITK